MKKIGVVSEVKLNSISNESINYEDSINSKYIYVEDISISVYDEKNRVLKHIKLNIENYQYNSEDDNILFLGDIVEYDIEANQVHKITENITSEQIMEIKKIYEKYMKRIEILNEKTFVEALAKCQHIEEVKEMSRILKEKNKFEQRMEQIKIRNILSGISDNLKLIMQLNPNISLNKKPNHENIESIVAMLDHNTNKLFSKIISSSEVKQDDLNKLYISYVMCKEYDSMWRLSHNESLFNETNLSDVWNLLIQRKMPPVSNQKVKSLN